jgi:hypothetical protein
MIQSIYRFLSPKFQNLFLEYPVKFEPRYGYGKPAHSELYSIINFYRNDYKLFLETTLQFKANLQIIEKTGGKSDGNSPFWNNGFLPGLDIVGIYSMLAQKKPRKYIEIGSGNSTKVAFKARQENQLQTEIISIDPLPRAEIDHLADRVVRKPFEKADYNVLFELRENDILFVDNSHRILPNSDSMVFFLEILPKLNEGVIVHLHDIYLPYDYPQFMCDRFYSEQYGLAMFLLANPGKYKPILPNYFIYEDKELSRIIEPVWRHDNLIGVERHGGSFWLQIQ